MIPTDLNTFAYLANWTALLEACAGLAQAEPWGFREPPTTAVQREYHILDRYLRAILRKQASERNWESDPIRQEKMLAVSKNRAVLNTGLMTAEYRAIYMLFERTNGRPGILQGWHVRDFVTEGDKRLLCFDVLPERPSFAAPITALHYLPELPIRVAAQIN